MSAVIKSEVMAALNKEVKSLDEDSWMFEGPRSRIHLISRPSQFFNLNSGKNQKVLLSITVMLQRLASTA